MERPRVAEMECPRLDYAGPKLDFAALNRAVLQAESGAIVNPAFREYDVTPDPLRMMFQIREHAQRIDALEADLKQCRDWISGHGKRARRWLKRRKQARRRLRR